MPEVGSASLAIIPSFNGFQSKLEGGTSKHMAAAGASGGSKFGDEAAKSGGARFKAGMAKAAKVAAAGLAIGIAGAIKFGGDALAEAREAQKVGALTESTIKATGGAAKVTAAQVDKLSGAISRKAGIDDEVIQRGANMLLTFKNIRNEAGKGNKIFNRTTKATADMAAAMAGGSGGEIDLKSASILLGKALNDPVKGLSALTRVGVQFTDQQKAINKALVEGGTLNAMAAMGTKVTQTEFNKVMKDNNATYEETVDLIMGPMSRAQEKLFKHYEEGGHALEAQRKILKEVNSQFGGAAAAQSTEADKLKVAWGNFKEEIGTQLIPVMDDLSKFLRKKGIPAAEDFVGWFKSEGIPALKKFGGHVKTVAGHAKDLVGWLNDLPKPAKVAGLVALFGGIAATKLTGGKGGALSTAGKALGLAKPVRTFETNPAALGGGGPGGMGKKVSTLAILGPVTLVAAGAITQKSLGLTPGQPFMPDISSDGGKLKFAKTAAKLVEWWDKIRGATDVASDAVLGYNRSIEKVPKLWSTVFEAPGLARDKALVQQYGSLLDGLDNRTITTFFRSVNLNKPGDVGEVGTTPGQPPNRSGPGVVINHNGNIVANSPRDYAKDMQRRRRHVGGGGVNIP